MGCPRRIFSTGTFKVYPRYMLHPEGNPALQDAASYKTHVCVKNNARSCLPAIHPSDLLGFTLYLSFRGITREQFLYTPMSFNWYVQRKRVEVSPTGNWGQLLPVSFSLTVFQSVSTPMLSKRPIITILNGAWHTTQHYWHEACTPPIYMLPLGGEMFPDPGGGLYHGVRSSQSKDRYMHAPGHSVSVL